MEIKRYNKNHRMSQIVTHENLIYLAGQVGYGDTVTDQTKSVLASIDELLAEVDSDVSRILTATIWLASMDYYDEFNAVWDKWIDPENPPARACGETRLATDDFLVEVIIVAAKK
ncbi:MAG: RidA family protein [Kordiimonadaceae bacterium]|nr:RidA family protein [Kordiimonadaceae bacterium]